MVRKIFILVLLALIVICMIGCGYSNYYSVQVSPVEFKQGKIGLIDFGKYIMRHSDNFYEYNNFIDFNTLDFSKNEYVCLNIYFQDNQNRYRKVRMSIDSVHVSFSDTTSSYYFDWIYNSTRFDTLNDITYSIVSLAPIHIPEKYKHNFLVSLRLQVYDYDTNVLVESKRVEFVNKYSNKPSSGFSLDFPCYQVDYSDHYKESKTTFGNLRFLISDIHFNEYVQDYYKEIPVDSSKFYYNLGVSYEGAVYAEQLIDIVVDSISFKYDYSDQIIELDWVSQKTKEYYGRQYTPIGALIIPKGYGKYYIEVELLVMIYDKKTKQLLSKNYNRIRLECFYNSCKIVNVKSMNSF